MYVAFQRGIMTKQPAVSDQIADAPAVSDPDVRMVLRTVYLPPGVDDELRVRAFHSNQTKNDLIREAVTRWLSDEAYEAASVEGKAASRAAPRRRPASRKTAIGSK